MKEVFNTIWNDPVWSKVISTGIGASIAAVFGYIISKCRNKVVATIENGYLIINNIGKEAVHNIVVKVEDSYIDDLSAIFIHSIYGKKYKKDILDNINRICSKKHSIKADNKLRLPLIPTGNIYSYRGLLDDNEECQEYNKYTNAVKQYFKHSEVTKKYKTITIKKIHNDTK